MIDLSLKIPKWFGISNYVAPDNLVKIETKYMLSSSLFWNIIREASEAGILTAITVLLSSFSATTTVVSVAVGIASAVGGGGLIVFGVHYLNRLASSLFATVLTMMLATGLIVGAVREFESAYMTGSGNAGSDVIYALDDANGNTHVLSAWEWCGISDSLTVASLVAYVLTIVGLCSAQVWNNYLGYDFLPKCVTQRGRSNTNVAGGDTGDGEEVTMYNPTDGNESTHESRKNFPMRLDEHNSSFGTRASESKV